MALRASYFKKTFKFNFKARTSRGLMKDREAWFIRVWRDENPTVFGIGECGPLPGLSIDAQPDLENVIQETCEKLSSFGKPDIALLSGLISTDYPSIMFAFETAFLDLLNGGKRIIFSNNFVKGQRIPINGLIWMGDMDFTMRQINIKIYDGFNCIKLKVGGLDFDRECDILNYIRKRYFREDIIIRLDANGAFKPDDVLYRLEELAKFNIHSIEQPIKPGLAEMEELCRKTPIPIAFDEELIDKKTTPEKINLLENTKPQYIILKPTLHGGLQQCDEWIRLANERGIKWWITSALESNVGLNAIAQFTANYPITTHQGLGTGMIYEENFRSPLAVKKGEIFYGDEEAWSDDELQNRTVENSSEEITN
jgi:O-succinylbenzoate synthase